MRWFAMAAVGVLIGCGSGPDDTAAPLSPDLEMTDENNYSYVGDIEISSVAVAAGQDSTVDWCGLSLDIRGREVADPSAVDRVLLIEVALTQEEAEAKIEENDLNQEDTVTQWILTDPGKCTANLSEFSILANTFDPADFVDNDSTWILSVSNFPDGRFDILMSTFVDPTDGETNTMVTVDNTSSTLDFDVDLTTLTPLQTSSSFDAYTLDWSGVVNDANGKPFDSDLGNRVLIGKIDEPDLSAVEEIFLRVDSEASELYYLFEIDGIPVVFGKTDADLSLATDESGGAFPGFTTSGIWLVGIECLSCTSPAPMLLSVVEVPE